MREDVATDAMGFLNRLPANSRTAHATAHVRDLREEARRERDEMRHVLSSMGIGFWDWDIAGLEIWYSAHVYELLGYDPEDVRAFPNVFRELIHPEDEAAADAAQNVILDGVEDNYRSEFRVRHKQGHWVWIEAIGRVVVRAPDSTALRLAGMFSCIDARRREQANGAFVNRVMETLFAQEDADAIMRTAIRMLGQYLGADRVSLGRLNVQNESMVIDMDWLGADVPQLVGEWRATEFKPTIDFMVKHRSRIVVHDTDTDPKISEETRRLFAKTKTRAAVAEPLILGENIVALLVITQSVPRRWQDDELALIKTIGMRLWNSVLRARAQERSRADKALLDMALNMAKLGAREKDYATGAITTSDNFLHVLGHPDATDLSWEEYLAHVHPEDRDMVRANFMRARWERGDEAIMREHRFITADETIRHMALTAKYHGPPDDRGKSNGYSAVIVQDITEFREKELAAESARDQLMKQSRLSAMGIMASTIAHELNQPLATAANYLAIIQTLTAQGAPVPAQIQDYVGRALDKVLQSGQIIRRVRNFAADGELQTSAHALRELVFKAVSSLFGRAGADRIAIINTVAKNVMVEVEPLLVEHALANVIRNAADALEGRTDGRIRVSAQVKGDHVELLIADNGPGMTEEVAASIFSPFVTTKKRGTGLGMPICRTMVEACGGKITLRESGPAGTIFCICLPAPDTDKNKEEEKG